MEKKIIGYKLIKPEYKEAIAKICGVLEFDFKRLESLTNISGGVNKLEKAGVLNLWFEPVYEKETKLEVGKWYRRTPSGSLMCYQGYKDMPFGKVIKGYGFIDGNWVSENTGWGENISDFILATEKEVKEALIKEAKKRYKNSENIFCSKHSHIGVWPFKGIDNIIYNQDDNTIQNEKLCYLFYEGKWSKIIKHELPEINGYIGFFDKKLKSLVYGCAEIPIKWFKTDETNRYIKSMTLSSGVTINEEQMDQIRKYLENN